MDPHEISSNPGRTDGATTSTWLKSAPAPDLPRLTGDVTCDVCVVGAGIAGLMTAYLLAREGRSVVVVDQGSGVGAGETGRTTAHLVTALDDRYYDLERVHGRRGAAQAAESHAAAITMLEKIARDERIECDFVRLDGYLMVGLGRPDDEIARELAATQRAGLATEIVARAPLEYDTGPCLLFPEQAQFHPMKFLIGLSEAIERLGGKVYGGAHVDDIEGGNPARIQTEAGPVVSADAVVVATNSPINDLVVMHTKQAPYRSYVIGCRVRRGSIERALYWDTLEPFHYARVHAAEAWDELIVGGEDHKTGQFDGDPPESRWERLEEWARSRFEIESVIDRWSGQVMEPVDGLAYIGRNPADDDNVYIVTGDGGNGMTHGAIAGMLLRDLIVGRESPWAGLYHPARKSLRASSLKTLVQENVNVAAQYLDWLRKGDVESADDIAPGQGAVVRRGLHLIAVYVDDQGQRTECSAACPHLGGVVVWNDAEKSWDCPCHGSRFDAFGRVIEGPAISDLARLEPETETDGNA